MKTAAFVAARFPIVSRPLRGFLATFAVLAFLVLQLSAQSPNTASVIVNVVDQNDAAVSGANISVENVATGAVRDIVAGEDGSATAAGLSLNGEYKITVTKTGFSPDNVTGLTLRAGETATVKVKLVVSGGRNEVTIFGTAEGVRADPQIGRRLDTAQIDETPILGRKASSAAAAKFGISPGKGNGRPFRQPDVFHHRRRRAPSDDRYARRREQRRRLGPPDGDRDRSARCDPGNHDTFECLLLRIRLDLRPGIQHRHQIRHERFSRRRRCSWSARAVGRRTVFDEGILSAVRSELRNAEHAQSISPVDIPDALAAVLGLDRRPDHQRQDVLFPVGRLYAAESDRHSFRARCRLSCCRLTDSLDYTGHYRQTLFDGRVDHQADVRTRTLMFRFNVDRFHDDNPQDAVGGTNAPSVARRYSRAVMDNAGQSHVGDQRQPAQRGPFCVS